MAATGQDEGRSGVLTSWCKLILLTDGPVGPLVNSSWDVQGPYTDLNWSKMHQNSKKGMERRRSSLRS